MTLQYVFHKAAVLVYATVLLLWNRQWFTAHATGVLSYLPAAYTVVANDAHPTVCGHKYLARQILKALEK